MQLDDFEESDGVTSEGKGIFLFVLEKDLNCTFPLMTYYECKKKKKKGEKLTAPNTLKNKATNIIIFKGTTISNGTATL